MTVDGDYVDIADVDLLLFSVGGPVAELMAYGEIGWRGVGQRSDWQEAEEATLGLLPPDLGLPAVDGILDRASRFARNQILEPQWELVNRVTAAVLEDRACWLQDEALRSLLPAQSPPAWTRAELLAELVGTGELVVARPGPSGEDP